MARFAALVAWFAAVAWPSFWVPFRGDEAWYLVVARDLAAGRVLYRDAWDVTNPGVFAFYWLAGELFGFTEGGVRLLDLLWQVAFALTVSWAVRRAYALPRLPLLPAVTVSGLYYLAGYSSSAHLTRVEGLAVFPIVVGLLGVWAAASSPSGRGRLGWAVVAGFAAGVVLLFKVVLLALVGVGWLTLLVALAPAWRSLAPLVGGLALGLGLALAPAVAYFAGHDVLGLALWTVFRAPALCRAEAEPAGVGRLVVAVQWFTGLFAAPLALAVLGAACRWRAARDPLLAALVSVLLLSAPVLLVQRLSWWSYHAMLPGGLVAVVIAYTLPALQAAAERWAGGPLPRKARAVFVAAACAGALPLLAAGGYQWLHGAKYRFGLTGDDRAAARAAQGNAYRLAQAEADWLTRPGRRAGPVYVCGDPLITMFSGDHCGNRISGWALEIWPAVVRRELSADLERRPPSLVFVARQPDDYEAVVRDRYPEFAATLVADYRVARSTASGTWYERR